jgi:hypothetical protein
MLLWQRNEDVAKAIHDRRPRHPPGSEALAIGSGGHGLGGCRGGGGGVGGRGGGGGGGRRRGCRGGGGRRGVGVGVGVGVAATWRHGGVVVAEIYRRGVFVATWLW